MRLDAVVVSAFVPAGPTPLSSPTPQMDIALTATPAPAPHRDTTADDWAGGDQCLHQIARWSRHCLRPAGQADAGQAAEVTNKSNDSQWRQICAENKTAWFAGQYVLPNESASLGAASSHPTPRC
jgi:hypothetical protein